MGKSVFITGATGFIGSKLAHLLAEEGNAIHALYRDEKKISAVMHPHIKWFKGDILDPDSLKIAMKGCTEVYHLAAYAKVWAKDPDTFYRYNVVGTELILKLAGELGVQKIVITSTAGVLGPSNEKPVTEDSKRTTGYFNLYEETKAIAEIKAQDYAKNGMHIVIVNPTRLYGPGNLSESNSVTKMVQQYIRGKWRIIPGNRNKVGNYVYIDDVVKGHILAMQHGKSGERYILGGENVSYHEFFHKLSLVSGKKYKLFSIPVWSLLSFSYFLLLYARIFGKAPFITPGWIRKYIHDWRLSSQKAKRELEYTVTPLEEGLTKTLKWLHENTDRT